jgi:hypothetical protein
MGCSSWEFSRWKKSSTFTLTKSHSSYNLIGLGTKDILCRTKMEEKTRGRKYLLFSVRSSEIPKFLPKSEIKSTVNRLFNLVSKTITLKTPGKAETSPLILNFRDNNISCHFSILAN